MQQSVNSMRLPSKARYDKPFQEARAARLEVGEKEYGAYKFLSADVINMAKEEVIDLANYAQFIYYKLCLLEEATKQGNVGPL